MQKPQLLLHNLIYTCCHNKIHYKKLNKRKKFLAYIYITINYGSQVMLSGACSRWSHDIHSQQAERDECLCLGHTLQVWGLSLWNDADHNKWTFAPLSNWYKPLIPPSMLSSFPPRWFFFDTSKLTIKINHQVGKVFQLGEMTMFTFLHVCRPQNTF